MMHSRQAVPAREVPGPAAGDRAVRPAGPGGGPAGTLLRPSAVPAVPHGPGAEQPPAILDQVLRGPGTPLDAGTRNLMERRLGAGFGHVRVHADAHAAASARALGAEAYTVGGSIMFAPGRYAPDREEGRELLAHELVHTLQQEASGPAPSGGPLSVEPEGSSAETEAQTIARASRTADLPSAASGVRRTPARISPSRVPATGVIQRQKVSGTYQVTRVTPLLKTDDHTERFKLPIGTRADVMDKGNRESNFGPLFRKREHSFSNATYSNGVFNGWIEDTALGPPTAQPPTGPQNPGPRQDSGPPTALPAQPPSVQPTALQPPGPQLPALQSPGPQIQPPQPPQPQPPQPQSAQDVPLLWEATSGSPVELALAELRDAEETLRRNGTAVPQLPADYSQITVNRTGRNKFGEENRKISVENQPGLTLSDKIYVTIGRGLIGTYSEFNVTVQQKISIILERAKELGYHVGDASLDTVIAKLALKLAEAGHSSTVANSKANTGHITFKDNI
jgi:hypothetical protein